MLSQRLTQLSATMKHLTLFLSALSLFAITSHAAPSAVHDAAGKPLQWDRAYYILPVYRGKGGGFTLAGRNQACPLNVAQEQTEMLNGLPVVFLPENPKDMTLRLSTDINILFRLPTACMQSTVWQVEDVDGITGKRYITTGGVRGSPGVATVNSWFKIEGSGFGEYPYYKLVYCPSVCNECNVTCADVGVFYESGRRWLGLGGESLPVTFKLV